MFVITKYHGAQTESHIKSVVGMLPSYLNGGFKPHTYQCSITLPLNKDLWVSELFPFLLSILHCSFNIEMT